MSREVTFLDGRVRLYASDNREALKLIGDASIDSVVTDPPYALVSIVKRFGADGSAEAKSNGATGVYKRASSGFMGKRWDTGEVAFDHEFWADVCRVLKPGGHVVAFGGTRSYHRLASAVEDAGFEIRDQIAWTYGSGFPKSRNLGNGLGTALKPAWEPIVLARKPLEGTNAENVLKHGVGALNIDGCRVASADNLNGGTYASATRTNGVSGSMAGPLRNAIGKSFVQPSGRWPANIVHDGSEEVLAAFPEALGQIADASSSDTRKNQNVYGAMRRGNGRDGQSSADSDNEGVVGFKMKPGARRRRGDAGSAARFFYCAKADANDRNGSKHPTVKPVDLMRWLCRLVTPPGGTVLDPFAGTGTTGEAAFYEGFNAILMEREAEYVADIERRMALVLAGPDARARAIASRKPLEPLGGLFAEAAE